LKERGQLVELEPLGHGAHFGAQVVQLRKTSRNIRQLVLDRADMPDAGALAEFTDILERKPRALFPDRILVDCVDR
jgi:hypothetical protein